MTKDEQAKAGRITLRLHVSGANIAGNQGASGNGIAIRMPDGQTHLIEDNETKLSQLIAIADQVGISTE